jgi:hypothetical protein
MSETAAPPIDSKAGGLEKGINVTEMMEKANAMIGGGRRRRGSKAKRMMMGGRRGSRKSKKSKRGGQGVIATAAVPFGLLALQRFFKGSQAAKSDVRGIGSSFKRTFRLPRKASRKTRRRRN